MTVPLCTYQVNDNFNSPCIVCDQSMTPEDELLGHPIQGGKNHIFHNDCIRRRLKDSPCCPYGDRILDDGGLLSTGERAFRFVKNLGPTVRDLTASGVHHAIEIGKKIGPALLAGAIAGYAIPTLGIWSGETEEAVATRLKHFSLVLTFSALLNSTSMPKKEKDKGDQEKYRKVIHTLRTLEEHDRESQRPALAPKPTPKDQPKPSDRLNKLMKPLEDLFKVDIQEEKNGASRRNLGNTIFGLYAGMAAMSEKAPDLLLAPLVVPILTHLGVQHPKLGLIIQRLLTQESVLSLIGSAFSVHLATRWLVASCRVSGAIVGSTLGMLGSIFAKPRPREYLNELMR